MVRFPTANPIGRGGEAHLVAQVLAIDMQSNIVVDAQQAHNLGDGGHDSALQAGADKGGLWRLFGLTEQELGEDM